MKPNNAAMPTNFFDQPRLHVDLRQAICALAEALSLVGIDERQHGERVAYIAVEIARQLGWDRKVIGDIFLAGLLHDCGVSSTRVHKSLISEMDWDGAVLHCVLGEYYLSQFPPTLHLAPIVRHHHTHWSDLGGVQLPEQSAISANLLFLADRVDSLRAQQLVSGTKADHTMAATIVDTIRSYTPSHFAPELVEAFTECAATNAFWYTLEPLALSDYIHALAEEDSRDLTEFDDIYRLAQIFARIVDAKSDFTFNHSVGVANLARYLAELKELPKYRADLVEIAALLHDLGKLGVPDELLEKNGPLNATEAEVMHRHSYETFRILGHIKGFEAIAEWAGNHHETLLGDGYPFHHSQSQLSIESRIISVADIFQALTQDRPYRKGMSATESLHLLQQMAKAGKVDHTLVELLAENLDACWSHARAQRDDWPLLNLT